MFVVTAIVSALAGEFVAATATVAGLLLGMAYHYHAINERQGTAKDG